MERLVFENQKLKEEIQQLKTSLRELKQLELLDVKLRQVESERDQLIAATALLQEHNNQLKDSLQNGNLEMRRKYKRMETIAHQLDIGLKKLRGERTLTTPPTFQSVDLLETLELYGQAISSTDCIPKGSQGEQEQDLVEITTALELVLQLHSSQPVKDPMERIKRIKFLIFKATEEITRQASYISSLENANQEFQQALKSMLVCCHPSPPIKQEAPPSKCEVSPPIKNRKRAKSSATLKPKKEGQSVPKRTSRRGNKDEDDFWLLL